jgi:hypothetical protein
MLSRTAGCYLANTSPTGWYRLRRCYARRGRGAGRSYHPHPGGSRGTGGLLTAGSPPACVTTAASQAPYLDSVASASACAHAPRRRRRRRPSPFPLLTSYQQRRCNSPAWHHFSAAVRLLSVCCGPGRAAGQHPHQSPARAWTPEHSDTRRAASRGWPASSSRSESAGRPCMQLDSRTSRPSASARRVSPRRRMSRTWRSG